MNPKVNELVNFYDREKENIKKKWNETETRIELINPLFECLGWDVNNNQKLPDNFKDVKHEANLKIGSNMKAPDYCFNYGEKNPLFYLEAKKPSVNIKTDINPAYQLRRYGWTKKLPISILTNFENLAIYDCSIKPNHNDSTGKAIIEYYTYTDYIDKWDEIYNFISKEAILHGSLNAFKNKQIKGTASIDDDFLDSIEKWRKLLALNIASKNPELNEYELNFAIQMIIDRIIFLRICEDRGIENYELLKDSVSNNNCYENLLSIFQKADDKYNSGLFHFKKEKDRGETPDNITPKLKIDDTVLKNIIKDLYYPDCPYELSVISSDVLGSVYERFLGKVIRLTDGHHAKVEEKPEVRKAGGVYYTPKYIVEYIVKNTVGEIIKDKTPNQVSNIKILDPACGSGSFLIEAYQYLLDWHLNYYSKKVHLSKDPDRWLKDNNYPLFKIKLQIDIKYESKISYALTLSERKKILINNIYGVDIDKNAVEVTKLSLLLKVLEYEGLEIRQKDFSAFKQDRVLPDLYNNIKCGNSLIGSDFYKDKNMSLFGNDEMQKINTFDWNKEFSEIFNNGGFDVVIGNPPYIKERGSQEIFAPIMQSEYKKYHQGKMDYWYYFLHRAIDECKSNGFIGFITNSYWLNSFGATKLIDRVKKELVFKKVVYFDDIKVFLNVSGKHMIHIYQKNNTNDNCIYIELDKNNFNDIINDNLGIKIKNNDIKKQKDIIVFSNEISIFSENETLDCYYEVSQGVVEATDKITKKQYENSKNKNRVNIGDGVFVLSKNELNNLTLNDKEKKIIKKYVNISHVGRYYINFQDHYLLYCDKQVKENIKEYPSIKNHLDNVKEFITSSNKPYGLHRPRENKYFESPKIICKGMFFYPDFYIDYDKYYFGFSFSAIIQKDKSYSLEFLLGLLNSKCSAYWFKRNGKKRGVGVDIGVLGFRQFPIPKLDLNNLENKNQYDNLVKLVNQMLETQKQFHNANADNDKKIFKQKIDIIDNQIENLVYELYGLNEDEIKVIEDSVK